MTDKRQTLTYVSMCVAGLQEVAEEMLRQSVTLSGSPTLMDGLLVYSTTASPDQIRRLDFFSNSFLLLRSLTPVSQPRDRMDELAELAAHLPIEAKEISALTGSGQLKQGQTFRIVLSDENRLVSAGHDTLRRLEAAVSRTAGLNLRADAHRPDHEIWLLRRREGTAYYLFRLTRRTTSRQLTCLLYSPEIALMMCHLSQPRPDDIFLDPFAGYGTIPLARLNFGPSQLVFFADIDEAMVRGFRQNHRGAAIRRQIITKQMDALQPDFFEDGFVSTIVTDPPWGYYESMNQMDEFYRQMLNGFRRIMRRGGRLVLLTARKDEFLAAAETFSLQFEQLRTYHILVSGKKAAIYVLQKKESV